MAFNQHAAPIMELRAIAQSVPASDRVPQRRPTEEPAAPEVRRRVIEALPRAASRATMRLAWAYVLHASRTGTSAGVDDERLTVLARELHEGMRADIARQAHASQTWPAHNRSLALRLWSDTLVDDRVPSAVRDLAIEPASDRLPQVQRRSSMPRAYADAALKDAVRRSFGEQDESVLRAAMRAVVMAAASAAPTAERRHGANVNSLALAQRDLDLAYVHSLTAVSVGPQHAFRVLRSAEHELARFDGRDGTPRRGHDALLADAYDARATVLANSEPTVAMATAADQAMRALIASVADRVVSRSDEPMSALSRDQLR